MQGFCSKVNLEAFTNSPSKKKMLGRINICVQIMLITGFGSNWITEILK